MSDAYGKVKRGGLKLKGGMKKKRRRADGDRPPKAPAAASAAPAAAEEDDEEFVVATGTGRISSSGTAVLGHETKFMAELAAGDAVVITHPTTLTDETRVVRMVLSDVSIAISSPFSTDLVSTCAFRFVAAPRVEKTEDEKAVEARQRYVQREDGAVGDYAGSGGTTLVYRTRKKGAVGGSNGYHIVTEKLTEEKTRTELLEMRSKYKSDRHCG